MSEVSRDSSPYGELHPRTLELLQKYGFPDNAIAAAKEAMRVSGATLEHVLQIFGSRQEKEAVYSVISSRIAQAAVIGYEYGLKGVSITQPQWELYKDSSNGGDEAIKDNPAMEVETVDPVVEAVYKMRGEPLPPLDSKEYKDLKEISDQQRELLFKRLGYAYGTHRDGGQ